MDESRLCMYAPVAPCATGEALDGCVCEGGGSGLEGDYAVCGDTNCDECGDALMGDFAMVCGRCSGQGDMGMGDCDCVCAECAEGRWGMYEGMSDAEVWEDALFGGGGEGRASALVEAARRGADDALSGMDGGHSSAGDAGRRTLALLDVLGI